MPDLKAKVVRATDELLERTRDDMFVVLSNPAYSHLGEPSYVRVRVGDRVRWYHADATLKLRDYSVAMNEHQMMDLGVKEGDMVEVEAVEPGAVPN